MKTKHVSCLIIAAILILTTIFAIANGDTLTALVEDFELRIEWKEIPLTQPIVTIDGRSFLPMRELANLLGYDVQWDEEKEEIDLSKETPPTSRIEKTIDKTHTEEELKELAKLKMNNVISWGTPYWRDVWWFGIEYSNRTNGYFYTVLKSDTGHYLVHLFLADRSISDYIDTHGERAWNTVGITSWYVKDLKSSKDFESLEIGKSTMADVRKIDPYLSIDMSPHNSGWMPRPDKTTHRTSDGKVIYIDYRPGIISKITVRDIEEDLLYFCLTPEDREVILAPLEPQNRPDQQES